MDSVPFVTNRAVTRLKQRFIDAYAPHPGEWASRGIIMNKRDKAIVIGYDFSEWVGEMAIAYSPAMVSVGMAMVAVSIALRGAIATNVIFDVAWAIMTAVCVDGLLLRVVLKGPALTNS